eukprot:GHVU01065893.1.p1 GENE.GHVU01065893.1~~GHVU01065893.1.p1  ORF type:complete len:199 (-),score=18.67 GHVU01065893.1:420-1016(-)
MTKSNDLTLATDARYLSSFNDVNAFHLPAPLILLSLATPFDLSLNSGPHLTRPPPPPPPSHSPPRPPPRDVALTLIHPSSSPTNFKAHFEWDCHTSEDARVLTLPTHVHAHTNADIIDMNAYTFTREQAHTHTGTHTRAHRPIGRQRGRPTDSRGTEANRHSGFVLALIISTRGGVLRTNEYTRVCAHMEAELSIDLT